MKPCTVCGKSEPEVEFSYVGKRKVRRCRPCKNAKARESYAVVRGRMQDAALAAAEDLRISRSMHLWPRDGGYIGIRINMRCGL